LVGKVKNIIGNTIESFGIEDVSPFLPKHFCLHLAKTNHNNSWQKKGW